MIYEFKNSVIEFCKSVRHFFRAMFCKDFYYESHGLGMCGRCGRETLRCDYRWCPKRKGADDDN